MIVNKRAMTSCRLAGPAQFIAEAGIISIAHAADMKLASWRERLRLP